MFASTTEMHSEPINLAIIGGGISGLALLIGILKHTQASQIRPHIYEANSTYAEIGAGLSFTPNCIRAMKLLDQELLSRYWATVLPKQPLPDGEEKKQPKLYFVSGVDAPSGAFKCFDHIFEQKATEAGGPGMLRKVFLDLLAGMVPDKDDTRGQAPYVSFHKKLSGVEELGLGEGVELSFEDGTKVHADAVVGCDGIRGMTRKILLERNGESEAIEPRFSGKFCYRGLIRLDRETRAEIGDEIAENMIFQWTYGAHLFAYPVLGGTVLNVVATHKTDDGTWPHEKWTVSANREKLEADMKLWGPPAQAVLRRMEDTDMWGLFEAQECNSFFRRGKMCIAGDCAHATTPHQAAGMSQCIEDALVLSMLLKETQDRDEDELSKVFAAYDAVRRPRSQKVINTSNRMSAMASFEDPEIGDDLDAIRASLETRFQWLWHVDLKEMVKAARDIYASA